MTPPVEWISTDYGSMTKDGYWHTKRSMLLTTQGLDPRRGDAKWWTPLGVVQKREDGYWLSIPQIKMSKGPYSTVEEAQEQYKLPKEDDDD
jgi:hypothetical protein